MHTNTRTFLPETWTNSVPLIFILLLIAHLMPANAQGLKYLFFGLVLIWALVIGKLAWPYLSSPSGWTRVGLELCAAIFLATQAGIYLLSMLVGGVA